jgi:hypothetical protein
MQYVEEDARRTPVVRDVDVLVAGGGIAGVAAAVRAAERGAEVLLVERYGYLGGITVGWPVPFVWQYGRDGDYYVQGFGKELIDRLEELGGWLPSDHPLCKEKDADGWMDVDLLRLVLAERCEEAGVEVLLHSWIADAVVQQGAVRGVIVENKSGRQALLGDLVVDATGDADVAALAGAALKTEGGDAFDPESGATVGSCSFGAKLEGVDEDRVQEFKEQNPDRFEELMHQLVEHGGVKKVSCASLTMRGDAVDPWDLTRMEMEGSRKALRTLEFLRANVPGYENAKLTKLSTQFGTRLGRRIEGVKTLTGEDVREARRHDDDICLFWAREGRTGVPYGALVPESLEGLVVGSRSISVESAAFGAIRLIGTAWALGEAAGTAAGLAHRQNKGFCELDVSELRAILQEQGAIV